MEIVFKNYDLNNDLDLLNKILARASKDRFELRQDTKNRYYLYDYDFKEVSRSKDEIKDIINEAGMGFVTAYDAFTKNPVTEDSERIYVLVREKYQERKQYIQT